MSIFRKPKIKTGDLVIGKQRLSFGSNASLGSIRYFDEPSLVLEIRGERALVFIEQDGPTWYNLGELERCYVKDEYPDGVVAKAFADGSSALPVQAGGSTSW